MMHRFIAAIVAISFCAGCNSRSSTSESTESSAVDKPRVALVMKSLANEFFSTMAEGAKSHQMQHSDQYDLVVNGIKDERDISRQVALVQEMASSILSEHPEIKAILAANDNMALGAIAASKSVGRTEDLLIVGFDNIAAVQDAIKAGKILATADQHGDQLAVYGIETALKMIANQEGTVENVQTPVDLVTAETLGE